MSRFFTPLALAALLFASCAGPEVQVSTTQTLTAPLAPAPFFAVESTSLRTDAPAIRAESAVLVNARTGQTLWAKNADQRRAPASTLKLVTALVLRDIADLDARVTVAPSDTAVEPSKLNLRSGDSYARRDLLTAMMVKSANDAAATLARSSAGSQAEFASLMNVKARELGAFNSNFANPHGLTAPGQYSTARDLARIALAAYRDPVLRDMMRRQSYTFRHADGHTTTLQATNKLLASSGIWTGMKTGYTVPAGRCLIASASLPGDDVILVQLGSNTRNIFDDAERIIAWWRG